jgi:hypothetical protein
MAALDEEMADHRHGEGGECGCNRAKPDFAALVRQGHVLRHGRDFPSLADVVKFRAFNSQFRKLPCNFFGLDGWGVVRNLSSGT